MTADCPDLERFVRGGTDATSFPHREHLRMAFEMLRRHDFAESVWLFSRALRTMTAKAGKPQAFHQTITVAFLSLVAERMELGRQTDFVTFEQAHPELIDKGVLGNWYARDQLASDLARRTFVLPARTP
jgi:hypothetical protein